MSFDDDPREYSIADEYERQRIADQQRIADLQKLVAAAYTRMAEHHNVGIALEWGMECPLCVKDDLMVELYQVAHPDYDTAQWEVARLARAGEKGDVK